MVVWGGARLGDSVVSVNVTFSVVTTCGTETAYCSADGIAVLADLGLYPDGVALGV